MSALNFKLLYFCEAVDGDFSASVCPSFDYEKRAFEYRACVMGPDPEPPPVVSGMLAWSEFETPFDAAAFLLAFACGKNNEAIDPRANLVARDCGLQLMRAICNAA